MTQRMNRTLAQLAANAADTESRRVTLSPTDMRRLESECADIGAEISPNDMRRIEEEIAALSF